MGLCLTPFRGGQGQLTCARGRGHCAHMGAPSPCVSGRHPGRLRGSARPHPSGGDRAHLFTRLPSSVPSEGTAGRLGCRAPGSPPSHGCPEQRTPDSLSVSPRLRTKPRQRSERPSPDVGRRRPPPRKAPLAYRGTGGFSGAPRPPPPRLLPGERSRRSTPLTLQKVDGLPTRVDQTSSVTVLGTHPRNNIS